jgi:penicillin-binding protein 1C
VKHGVQLVGLRSLGLAVVLTALGLWGWVELPTPAPPPGGQPSWDALWQSQRAQQTSSEAWLLDRQGIPLQSLRLDASRRQLAWTPLAQIAPALQRAVIRAEDRRFADHSGIDWLAAAHALWALPGALLRGEGRPRGASTLSMQLAALLDPDSRRAGSRSLLDKLAQARAARQIERHWSKDQILEAYLNLVSFRGELQGVAAMSRRLFGKGPDGLDDTESAIAAALLRAPNASGRVVTRRACALLAPNSNPEDPVCAGLGERVALTLQGSGRGASASDTVGTTLDDAPHLARRLLSRPGQQRRSSLIAPLQRAARQILHRQLVALVKRHVEDGAVLVLDNASGEVLAWVGSSGDLSQSAQVDGVSALRQAGSTLKPFLYAQAFAEHRLTPGSLLDDRPLSVDVGQGLYTPQNYEPHYRGWVSARAALAGSLNVPAVRTILQVGPEAFAQQLRRLGLESLVHSGDWYGPSLALGSADVSLLMLTNAYRALAQGGRWTPVRVQGPGEGQVEKPIEAPPLCAEDGCRGVFSAEPHQALDAAASFLVADILSDRSARAGTFGLDSWLSTPYWSAVKTGTSKDMRDNWCLGFSRRYTVGVWVGNASGSPMHDVSGITGAAPIWRELMDWLHRGDPQTGRLVVPSLPPEPPPGVEATRIRYRLPQAQAGAPTPESTPEPPRTEWFLRGTAQSVFEVAQPVSLSRIDYPTDGLIVALDPDIPPERQRIPLRLSGAAGSGWSWRLDGQPLGSPPQVARWRPEPGAHRLELLDAQGTVLDQVAFEVRALRASLSPAGRAKRVPAP